MGNENCQPCTTRIILVFASFESFYSIFQLVKDVTWCFRLHRERASVVQTQLEPLTFYSLSFLFLFMAYNALVIQTLLNLWFPFQYAFPLFFSFLFSSLLAVLSNSVEWFHSLFPFFQFLVSQSMQRAFSLSITMWNEKTEKEKYLFWNPYPMVSIWSWLFILASLKVIIIQEGTIHNLIFRYSV